MSVTFASPTVVIGAEIVAPMFGIIRGKNGDRAFVSDDRVEVAAEAVGAARG